MDASEISSQSQAVDLSEYAADILNGEDRPLFEEAVQAAKAGAVRSAYIMVWLACAESLKRRFNEAKTRDNTAGRIAGEIKRREDNHRPWTNTYWTRLEITASSPIPAKPS